MTSINLTCSGCKRRGMGGHSLVGTLDPQRRRCKLYCIGILPTHKVLYSCGMKKLLLKKGFCTVTEVIE